jgi:hypothetical protein
LRSTPHDIKPGGLLAVLCLLVAVLLLGGVPAAGDVRLPFTDHGVMVPVSYNRGAMATTDGAGNDIVLLWLSDCRGGYALLSIDAATGETAQYPLPFPEGDGPYCSILSGRKRYYAHFNSYFVEFDVEKKAFTFVRKTAPQMAMSMTEDDRGVIWSVTYPQSGLVSYNPETGEFRDYGSVYRQNWSQYPNHIAADDKGFIYFALGETATQIVAFNPATGEATPMIPEEDRRTGTAKVYRDIDGCVYGQPLVGNGLNWYRFHEGKGWKIGRLDKQIPKEIAAGPYALRRTTFPDGKKIALLDLNERRLVVEDPRGKSLRKELHFDYATEGSHIMSVTADPAGTLWGGTTFPMRSFAFDVRTGESANRESYGQWNTVAAAGGMRLVGGYGKGFVLEWDPSEPWVATTKNRPSNPRYAGDAYPHIDRPHKLLALPDGRTVILAGTPAYGATGGGLLFWNRQNGLIQVFNHTELIPNHSTMSLAALPGCKTVVGGTTTAPGTGGEKKAKEAELYLLDLKSKKLLWHQAVLPGAQEYTDLCNGPCGLVYGVADKRLFFVFDPVRRKVTLKKDISGFGSTAYAQGRGSSSRVPAGGFSCSFTGVSRKSIPARTP